MITHPTHKKFFDDEMKDWSERKLKLLGDYLDPAVRILGSISQVCYVDGFAGKGIYQDGSKGSPVRAAELAQRCVEQKKSYTLKCINIEEDPENFTALQSATASFGEVVVNLPGTFVSNIERILQEIKAKPAVCFLDPFGTEGIDRMAIQRLIRRPYPTDFWIRFDTKSVLRHAGFLDSDSRVADKRVEIIERIYGTQDRDLLKVRLDDATSEERIKNALKLYQQCLAQDFTQARGNGYAANYKIKSLKEGNKYFLVFATGSDKAISLASNVVYGAEENYQTELESYKKAQTGGKQLSMFDASPEEIFDEKVRYLKESILKQCQGQKLTRLQIHVKILTSWFGKIKGPHLTKALKSLVEEDQVAKIVGDKKTYSADSTLFSFF